MKAKSVRVFDMAFGSLLAQFGQRARNPRNICGGSFGRGPLVLLDKKSLSYLLLLSYQDRGGEVIEKLIIPAPFIWD